MTKFLKFFSLFDFTNKCFENENSISEIIHDLKTPASAQLRACELLLNGCFGQLKDGQKEIIVTMTNSNRYMLDLINNVLIFSKFKHKKIEYEFETFNINELINTVITSLTILAEEKNCRIEFQSREKEIYINAYKTGIKRVIVNLISNAVKFADCNSTIIVKMSSDKINCEFSVLNYGKYIKQNDFKNIFKKYKSIGNYGNGLGLYISDLIISKHNSKIQVKSSKENGNCFSFKLPEAEVPVLISQ